MSIDEDEFSGLYSDPKLRSAENFYVSAEKFCGSAQKYCEAETRANSMDAGLDYSQTIHTMEECMEIMFPDSERGNMGQALEEDSLAVLKGSAAYKAVRAHDFLSKGEKHMMRGMNDASGDFRTPLAFARDFGPGDAVKERVKYIVAEGVWRLED